MKKNLLRLFACAFLIITLTGCSDKEESNSAKPNSTGNNNKTNEVSNSDLEKNITTSAEVSKRDRLIVFVKNDNKVAVDMNVEVEFYDKDNNIVGSDTKTLTAVGKNAEVAIEMWDTPESFDNYKIYVDVENTREKCYFDDLEVKHNDTGEQVAVQIKNNSEDTIEYVSATIVYYQNNKVVGYDDDMESDVKAGRSANFNFDYPYDNNYDDVKYDSYKVFIAEAYSYNW